MTMDGRAGVTERSRIAGQPASVWRRIAAIVVDYLLIVGYLVIVAIVSIVLRSVSPRMLSALFGSPMSGELSSFVLVTLPVTLYFAISEASPRGATWGKRRIGLRVVTSAGERLTVARSLARTAGKFVPWELSHAAVWQFLFAKQGPLIFPSVLQSIAWVLVILNVITAFVDPSHRALHDRIAGTRVVTAA
jgi:uncharacterized RDD family membrane protein YckC